MSLPAEARRLREEAIRVGKRIGRRPSKQERREYEALWGAVEDAWREGREEAGSRAPARNTSKKRARESPRDSPAWPIALHEAGHAVVALATGGGVTGIQASRDEGRCAYDGGYIPAVLAAGTAATHHLPGPWPGGRYDRRDLRQWCQERGFNPQAMAYYGEQRAKAILRTHWPVVEKLAEACIRNGGEVGSEELHRITRDIRQRRNA